MSRYVAVDLIVSDNKKFLTDGLLLTDDLFEAKHFISLQDCEYFISVNDLSYRVKPLQVNYYFEMSKQVNNHDNETFNIHQ